MIRRATIGALVIALFLTLPSAGARAEIRQSSGTAESRNHAPNLTPQAPSAAPLLRKINAAPATMIPMFYCTGISADRETEVDVPAFDWGVANDDRAEVRHAFTVAIVDAASPGGTLVTEAVPSILRSGTRVFRNWPGRPTRVRVIHVTAANPKFRTEYGAAPGCYIPTALAGSVTLDPGSLIVRVDARGEIAERLENDNDLTR